MVGIISGSVASRRVLEDWDALDSDVDDVAEEINSKTSKHVSKSWTVTSRISSYFIAIWTFITVSFTHTVDAAYRLVGRHRDTHLYATPHRKLVILSVMFMPWLSVSVLLTSKFAELFRKKKLHCFVLFCICHADFYVSFNYVMGFGTQYLLYGL